MPDIQLRDVCSECKRSYSYVTSKSFGWCRGCREYDPVTLESALVLDTALKEGRGFHPAVRREGW